MISSFLVGCMYAQIVQYQLELCTDGYIVEAKR